MITHPLAFRSSEDHARAPERRRCEDWLINAIGGSRDARHRGWYFLEFRSLCARKIYGRFPVLSRATGENHGKLWRKERRGGKGTAIRFVYFPGAREKKPTKAEITSGYVIYVLPSPPSSLSFF